MKKRGRKLFFVGMLVAIMAMGSSCGNVEKDSEASEFIESRASVEKESSTSSDLSSDVSSESSDVSSESHDVSLETSDVGSESSEMSVESSEYVEVPEDPSPTYTDEEGETYIPAFVVSVSENKITVDVTEYITRDNVERIQELNLTEDDLVAGYYYYNPDHKTVEWELNEQTVYHFIDRDNWGGNSIPYITTTSVEEFLQYIGIYSQLSLERMPFFFQVEDGVVKLFHEMYFV